jgi:uncharacterized membrane protein YczE
MVHHHHPCISEAHIFYSTHQLYDQLRTCARTAVLARLHYELSSQTCGATLVASRPLRVKYILSLAGTLFACHPVLFVTLELSTATEKKTFSVLMRSCFILVVLVLVTYATKEDDIRAYLATCSTRPTKLALSARFRCDFHMARQLINEAVRALSFCTVFFIFFGCVRVFVVSVPFCLHFVFTLSQLTRSYIHCSQRLNRQNFISTLQNTSVHCSVVQ